MSDEQGQSEVIILSDPSQLTPRYKKKRSRSVPEDKENSDLIDNVSINEIDRALKKKKKKRREEATSEKKKIKKKESGRGKKKKKKDTSKYRVITPGAIEAIVAFAHASGKETHSLAKNLVGRIRLCCEDPHLDSSNTQMEKPAHDQMLLAMMDDGRHSLPIFVVNDNDNEMFQKYVTQSRARQDSADWICIDIKGLVTTDGYNPKFDLEPIVCVTRFEIASKVECPSEFGISFSTGQRRTNEHNNVRSSSTARVRSGTIGTFLEKSLSFLTTEELVWCHDTNIQQMLLAESSPSKDFEDTREVREAACSSIASINQYAEQVQSFVTRHKAMMTLDTSQPTEHAVQSYTKALNEFEKSQLDRQKASLASNAGREAADRAHVITQQYNAALEEAMMSIQEDTSSCLPTDSLTPDRLLKWHSTLLDGLHSEAGKLRTKTVRAGNTVFTRPKDIVSELDKFCLNLATLQRRLLASQGSTSTGDIWQVTLFAAIAMYGLVDIHPFADGNGRMSRIVANWAFKAFPFTINIFATAAQRAEYILALETTRHLLSLASGKKVYGTTSVDEDTLLVGKSAGIFAPCVRLLMDRVGRAVIEFTRVWQEKLGLAVEAMEYRAARQARERAKEGTCLICLDEGPNIATLCCGNAVHLNCIAEWLSGKNTCPNCRSEMPSISGRVVRAAQHGAERGSNGSDHRNGVLLSPSSRRLRRRYYQNAQDVIVSLLRNYSEHDNTTTETVEGGYDSAQETTAATGENEFHAMSDQEDILVDVDDEESSDFSSGVDSYTGESDSSESSQGSAVPESQNNRFNVRNSGSDSVDSSAGDQGDPNSSAPSLQVVHEYCDALYCRNRPASDCANNLCGRCCVLGGEFHCPRHNS